MDIYGKSNVKRSVRKTIDVILEILLEIRAVIVQSTKILSLLFEGFWVISFLKRESVIALQWKNMHYVLKGKEPHDCLILKVFVFL